MQITKVEVTQAELSLRHPVRMAHLPEIRSIAAIFVRLETRDGLNAWGGAVAHPDLTGEKPEAAYMACQACADRVPSLHPTNIEYSLAELSPLFKDSLSARCAFDLAFHDLLGLAASMPIYRLLGGYRNRIQTSVTIPILPLEESVEMARRYAHLGFRELKIKGGLAPEADVQRIQAIQRALSTLRLCLDSDGGYTLQQAIDVARALKGLIDRLEQPTPAGDWESLSQLARLSPVPIWADQSMSGPAAALTLAAQKMVHGLGVKVSTCGGLRGAFQVEAIARAAHLATGVSCIIEPALLIAAGLSLALSSPNVHHCDLDGHLDLLNDPTIAGFQLADGYLVASDVPGLGCTVDLG